ncbi:flagellar biosynthesis anti-sigma factor FlgM [Paenibacillus lutrae]|uniref:Negative regulator of flagellin synthesis n=1 Tax=Paenibacillus lutrae TaxID=2078573 RepID=A0A7X3FKU3_9BACL|nr:flagellar biosynthesis anti-sigma factor FlgM [Paenibacillus lutrae]MVP01543.1 flagellar biosynthesis anti-sigma factor FlgM [Paenibacillus lutrae]
MKINESHRIGNVNPYAKHKDQMQVSAADKRNRPKDEVQISTEAKQLLGAAGDEVRARKVEELKQQVRSGTYHVEAGKIAEKLLPYLK